jgi:hypothetical protein
LFASLAVLDFAGAAALWAILRERPPRAPLTAS